MEGIATRQLKVEIIGDSKNLEHALGRASSASSKLGGSLRTLGKVAAVGVGAAFVGFAATLKVGFDELMEGQKVAAQTNAVLKSTGGVANVTAKQVAALAQEQSNLTGIDDELIQTSENLLLTFKNVRNEVGKGSDVFNRATKAALDLSTAGFGSVESASKMMGKALNDPIKGMTALGRAGVTFSDDQKKAIKALVETGDVLGAQKLILKEVESQVGGSAKAYGETLPGQLAKLRNSFDDIAGSIAGAFAPALADAAGGIANFLQDVGKAKGFKAKLNVVWEGIQDVARGLWDKLTAAFRAIDWGAVWAGVTNAFGKIRDAFDAIDWSAVGQTLSAGFSKALEFLGSIDYAGILGSVMTRVFEALRTMIESIDWNALGQQIGAFIVTALNGIAAFIQRTDWNKVGQALVQGFKMAIAALATFLAGVDWLAVIGAIIRGLTAVLKGLGELLIGIMLGIGKSLLQGLGKGLDAAWPGVRSWFTALPGKIVGFLGNAASWLVEKGVAVIGGLLRGAVSKWADVARWYVSLPGKILSALGDLASLLYDVGVDLIQGLWDGVKAKAAGFLSYLGGLADKAKSVFTLGLAGSPEYFTYYVGKDVMAAFARGLAEGGPKVEQTMRDLLQGVKDAGANFAAAYADLASQALAAFDAKMSTWKPPAQIRLDKLHAKEQLAQLKADVTAGVNGVREANAALQAALAGGDPEAIKAAQDALTNAEAQALAARRAMRDYNLEQDAARQQAAHDKQVAQDKRDFQDRFDKIAADAKRFAESGGKMTAAEAANIKNRTAQLLKDMGLDAKFWGTAIGISLAEGLQQAQGAVRKAAIALANAVRKLLKTSSPAEEGPMADLDVWWSGFASTLVRGIDYGVLDRAGVTVAETFGGGIQRGVAGIGARIADVLPEGIGQSILDSIAGVNPTTTNPTITAIGDVSATMETATTSVDSFGAAIEALPSRASAAFINLVDLIKKALLPLPDLLAPTALAFIAIADSILALGNASYQARAALRDTAADIAKLLQQIAAAGAAYGGDVDHRQHGGPVKRNTPYIVGEAGPELFIPSTSGRIATSTSSGGMAAAGGLTVNVYNAGSVISERDLVESVYNGLLARQRRIGTLGFN